MRLFAYGLEWISLPELINEVRGETFIVPVECVERLCEDSTSTPSVTHLLAVTPTQMSIGRVFPHEEKES